MRTDVTKYNSHLCLQTKNYIFNSRIHLKKINIVYYNKMHDLMLLDCTIRDGGYINRWQFTDECVSELVKTLDDIGYDYVELGFRNNPQIYNNKPCGKWRYCTEKDLVKVVPEKRKIKISVMADYKTSNIELFSRVEDTVIDMVRVAFHIPELEGALNFCKQLKQLGYIVCANAMATMNYTDDNLQKLCSLAHSANVDFLYLADSYGCLMPNDVEYILTKMKKNLPSESKIKLGAHLHNNIQNAVSNFYRLNEKDLVTIFDSTILGMGRGAGNLSTELVVNIENSFTDEALKDICLFAEKYISPLYGNAQNWGSDIAFIISARFRCHPNYILKLKDFDIVDIQSVWKYINAIYEAGKHSMFDHEYLNNLVAENTVNVSVDKK